MPMTRLSPPTPVKRNLSFLFAVLLALFTVVTLPAQIVETGIITGEVKDNTGAVVTNALVVVTDTATARKYQHHGAPDGQYNFPYLPAGQRSSIAFIISSAHRTASAIALIVAGTLFPPSN